MTITQADSEQAAGDYSLRKALARVASPGRPTTTAYSGYSAVTVRITVRDGKVTKVVAV